MQVKFYRNKTNEDVTMSLLERSDDNLVELLPNTSDGAKEKHVPVFKREGNVLHVEVGSVLHPMTDAHYIDFICVVTNKKADLKHLERTGKPAADFDLAEDEKIIAIYEYCNLHGLWANKVNEK